MTRHRTFDVRVAPDVEQAVRAMAHRPGTASTDAKHVLAAQQRLAAFGTRANGAKKLRSLALWEIRAGRQRIFFCPVPGTRRLAVGALIVKSTSRLRTAKLKAIEHEVHRWRDELKETP